jgi:hypothetical protein
LGAAVVNTMRAKTLSLASAGLFIAPAAWAFHQQVGYMLTPASCGVYVPVLTLASLLIAAAGGFLSWRAWNPNESHPVQGNRSAGTQRFLSGISLALTGLFALTILLQGAAALIVDGCLI